MASRRFRIKAVANVPIRRGKINTDSERSETSYASNEIAPVIELKKEEIELSETKEPSEDLEQNGSHQNSTTNEIVPASENVHSGAKNDSDKLESLQISRDETRTLENGDFVAIKVENVSPTDTGKSIAPALSTNIASKSGIPPGLVRKRMKPAVSIAAVSRRPRELNNSVNNSGTSSNISEKISDKDVSQNYDKRNDSFTEKPRIISPAFEKVDRDVPILSSRDIGAGIPGITQIIPTGTAIRPQHVANSSTPVLGKGEAPQSMPEPDLPSEGAGGGDSVISKPVPPLIPILQRSRFAKPAPRIVGGVRINRSGVTGCNNETQKCSTSEAALPHNTEQEEQLADNKCGSSASASESDDESRKCMSDASTITPPVRKLAETSRARFQKPTPNFIEASARRSSIQGSASESEDESRRSISIASTVTPPNRRHIDVNSEEQAEKNYKEDFRESPEKKVTKPKRPPSSCTIRMNQARHEFQAKFGNQTPDRSRMTMYDLIFYNPSTNPMKSSDSGSVKSGKSISLVDEEEKIIEERLEEEQVDEPSAQETRDKSVPDEAVEEEEEEEEAMPVPQVKVGPDGQIILDEKSLVIETTGTKKSREDLANSAIIVDTGTYGNGFYSRKFKKSKEWSKEETLKFYRALNTVGTDFSMMKSIFPKRSRQDLKVKFKREDRLNRYLVEKALLNPLTFDLTELEKDLEKEEEEEKMKELKKKMPRPKPPRKPKLPKKRSKKTNLDSASDEPQATSSKKPIERTQKEQSKKIIDGDVTEGDKSSFSMQLMDENDRGAVRRKQMKKKVKKSESEDESKLKRPPRKRRKVEYVSSSDEENELQSEFDDLRFDIGADDREEKQEEEGINAGASEAEFLAKPPKPTRSGRIPQRRKLLGLEDNEAVTKNREPSKDVESQPMPLEDLTNLEPGSLVVLATQSPTNPGHHIYKVFMVAPNAGLSNAVPLPQSLQSLPDNFVAREADSCNQGEPQNESVTELLPVEEGPMHGQLAELLPVQEALPAEGQIGDFLPVHDAGPLTSQLAELLPLQSEQPPSPRQAEFQGNESLSMELIVPQSVVLLSKDVPQEVNSQHVNPQVISASDQTDHLSSVELENTL